MLWKNDLSEALQAVRAYRGEGLQDDLEDFAEAEVSQHDPIQSRLEIVAMADRFDVSRIFA